jgi:hypothetical protein
LISFSCFGFVAVVPGNPETQTVSHSFPKLCVALQRNFGADAAYRARPPQCVPPNKSRTNHDDAVCRIEQWQVS